MKKLLLIALAVIISLFSAACSAQPEPVTEAATEPEPQLHTVAAEDAEIEPEWANIDCELTLMKDGEYLLDTYDFECFAIVPDGGNYDMIFKLDEDAAQKLNSVEKFKECTLFMNGEEIGAVAANGDASELRLVGDYTYVQLCELADKIRGL